MRRLIGAVTLIVLAAAMSNAIAVDSNVIKAQKTKDVNVRVLSESGQWKPGKNDFVLEFTSAKDDKPVDVGKVTLSTSMSMPGMAPMVAGANLTPDGQGRYRGSIAFPDAGERQVTVRWDGPAGTGSTKFSVAVR